MKVLVACEFSGIVREAFKAKGHDAWSCDLLPTEIPGNHYQGNIYNIFCNWNLIGGVPDIIIAHPVCTRRANSGVRWLKYNIERMKQLRVDDTMFNDILNLSVSKICIENPIPNKYSKIPKYTQIIQPWQFGEDASKATCLWLKGLPRLVPTNIIKKNRYSNQTPSGQNNLPPSAHRAKDRSRTYQGIAEAMADQWGTL